MTPDTSSDLLGFKPGTLRGLMAVAAFVYLGIFYGYNVYAELMHHTMVAVPYAVTVGGYIAYYLGLRTNLPDTGGLISSLINRIFVHPNIPQTSVDDLPTAAGEGSDAPETSASGLNSAPNDTEAQTTAPESLPHTEDVQAHLDNA